MSNACLTALERRIMEMVRSLYNNPTIGIIIYKRENRFIIEYCLDPKIIVREYKII